MSSSPTPPPNTSAPAPAMIKGEFVVDRQGKSYVLYAGLLDLAHAQGLKSIRTQLLQTPSAENAHVAICYAEVTTDNGTFTGIGDASPENVSRLMVPHIIRMAETRAKARALRDATNVGAVALEEIADGDDDDRPQRSSSYSAPHPPAAPSPNSPPTARTNNPAPAQSAQSASPQTHTSTAIMVTIAAADGKYTCQVPQVVAARLDALGPDFLRQYADLAIRLQQAQSTSELYAEWSSIRDIPKLPDIIRLSLVDEMNRLLKLWKAQAQSDAPGGSPPSNPRPK